MSTIAKTCEQLTDEVVVAADPRMLAVLEMARTVARHKAAVLVTGETGVGKEVIARVIHQHSTRCYKPWVDFNCAALPEHLVESELFGYEKGAFSGADSVKPGLFELANGGTLFLDEIGEIEPKVQVKLLRVLDGMPYYRLGGNRKVVVDVRLVAATNRNLEAAVQAGTFRSDLYHRINEVHIHVPPLRERTQDIAVLAEYFLAQRCPDMKFTRPALDLLAEHEWPGNVRELRNLILKLSILTSDRQITADVVSRYVCDIRRHSAVSADLPPENAVTLNELERLMIIRTLETVGGNQSRAAERLGIPRRTFCRKLNEHKITLGRRSRASFCTTSPLLRNYRAELDVPVTVQTKEGISSLAKSRNLSMGGLCLQDIQLPLAVSDELILKFDLPEDGCQIEVKAEVMWYRPDGTAGTQFTLPSNATSVALGNWIARRAQGPLEPVGDSGQHLVSAL